MDHAVASARVHAQEFNLMKELSVIENKTVSRLIKDSLYDYCSRRADVMIECVEQGSMIPAAAKRAKVYADLAREFSK